MLEKKEIYIRYLISALAALAGAYGVSYLFMLKEGSVFGYGLIPVLVFAYVFLIWERGLKRIREEEKIHRGGLYVALIMSFGISLSYILGYQLEAMDMTALGLKGKAGILVRSFCLMCALFPLIYSLTGFLVKKYKERKASAGLRIKKGLLFVCVSVILMLCWLPVFLAYYPAIMTFDFHRQAGEAARGFIWFNSYQPLAHTLLIWVAFQIGNAVGSLETGMACYSIFQMLVLAVSMGYVCTLVYRLVKRIWPVVVLTVFFGCFPFIPVLAVCVTKDIIFTALFLIFMCLFVERSYFVTGKKRVVLDVLWVLEGILMILFRNNALYAVAVFALFFVVMSEKKQRIGALLISLALIAGGKGALEGIQAALGTTIRGSQVEMFSVPIQQMARVGYLHGEDMPEDVFMTLDYYVPWPIWHDYNAPLADTVKNYVANFRFNDTWKGNYGGVMKAWVEIGLKYPQEYVDAFLELTAGYWFPDDRTWCEVLGYGADTRMGAIYTYNAVPTDVIPEGIAHVSKLPGLEESLEKIVSGNSFYNWPVLSVFFKPALYVWAFAMVLLLAMAFKERKKMMIMLLPLMYFGTLLLGPVVQVRYIFTMVAVLPLLWALFYYKQDDKSEILEPTE